MNSGVNKFIHVNSISEFFRVAFPWITIQPFFGSNESKLSMYFTSLIDLLNALDFVIR